SLDTPAVNRTGTGAPRASRIVGLTTVTRLIATVALGAAGLALVVPTAAAQSPSDREIAKAGVFQAVDFPAGWRSAPPKGKTDPNACPALKKAVGSSKNRTAKVTSDDFERQNDKYSSAVFVYRTEDLVRRVYNAVNSRSVARCLQRFVKDALKKGVEGA